MVKGREKKITINENESVVVAIRSEENYTDNIQSINPRKRKHQENSLLDVENGKDKSDASCTNYVIQRMGAEKKMKKKKETESIGVISLVNETADEIKHVEKTENDISQEISQCLQKGTIKKTKKKRTDKSKKLANSEQIQQTVGVQIIEVTDEKIDKAQIVTGSEQKKQQKKRGRRKKIVEMNNKEEKETTKKTNDATSKQIETNISKEADEMRSNINILFKEISTTVEGKCEMKQTAEIINDSINKTKEKMETKYKENMQNEDAQEEKKKEKDKITKVRNEQYKMESDKENIKTKEIECLNELENLVHKDINMRKEEIIENCQVDMKEEGIIIEEWKLETKEMKNEEKEKVKYVEEKEEDGMHETQENPIGEPKDHNEKSPLMEYLLKETKKDNKQILSELRNTLFSTENKKRPDMPIEGINNEEMDILNKWYFANKLKILECFFENRKLGSHIIETLYAIHPSFKYDKIKIIKFLKHMKKKNEETLKQNEKEEKIKIQKSNCYDTILNLLNGDISNINEKIYMSRFITLLKNENNLMYLQFYIEHLLEKGETQMFDVFLENNGLLCFKIILQRLANKVLMKYHPSLILVIMNFLKKCDISLEHLKCTLIGVPINLIAKNKKDERRELDYRTDNQKIIKLAEELVAQWKEIRDKTLRGEISAEKKTVSDIKIENTNNLSERSYSVIESLNERDDVSSSNMVLMKSKTENLQNSNLTENIVPLKAISSENSTELKNKKADNNIMLSLLGCINQEHEKKKKRHLEYKKAKLEGKFKKHTAIKNSIESNKKRGSELEINKEDLINLKKEKELKDKKNMPFMFSYKQDRINLVNDCRNDYDLSRYKRMDKVPSYKIKKMESSMENSLMYKSDRTNENIRNRSFHKQMHTEVHNKQFKNNMNASQRHGIYEALSVSKADSQYMNYKGNTQSYHVDHINQNNKDYYHDSRSRDYVKSNTVINEFMNAKYSSRNKTAKNESAMHLGKTEKTDRKQFANVQPLPTSLLPLQELFPLPKLPPLPLPTTNTNSPTWSYTKSQINRRESDNEMKKVESKIGISSKPLSYDNDDQDPFGTEKRLIEDPFKRSMNFYEEQINNIHDNNNNNNDNQLKNDNINNFQRKAYMNNYTKRDHAYLKDNKMDENKISSAMHKEKYSYNTVNIKEQTNTQKNYTNKVITYKQKSGWVQIKENRKFPIFENLEIMINTKETYHLENLDAPYPSKIMDDDELAESDKIIFLSLNEYQGQGPFVIRVNDILEKNIEFKNEKLSGSNDFIQEDSANVNIPFANMTNSLHLQDENNVHMNFSPKQKTINNTNHWDEKNEKEKVTFVENLYKPLNLENTNPSMFSPNLNFHTPPYMSSSKKRITPPIKKKTYSGWKCSPDISSEDTSKIKVTSSKGKQYESADHFIAMFDEDFQKVLKKNVDLTRLLMSKPEVVEKMLKGPQYITETLNSLTEELKSMKEHK